MALVMVSLYEGFGLPLLEAMSCGTPVITSTLASMPEVAGDAALQVDPYDIGTISQALMKIASDQELRRRLGLLGIERARLFTWDITAKRVNDAIAASM
jgi:glycosyltransferase involved in cell wall biosynthesis